MSYVVTRWTEPDRYSTFCLMLFQFRQITIGISQSGKPIVHGFTYMSADSDETQTRWVSKAKFHKGWNLPKGKSLCFAVFWHVFSNIWKTEDWPIKICTTTWKANTIENMYMNKPLMIQMRQGGEEFFNGAKPVKAWSSTTAGDCIQYAVWPNGKRTYLKQINIYQSWTLSMFHATCPSRTTEHLSVMGFHTQELQKNVGEDQILVIE